MKKRTALKDRTIPDYTRGEEIMNMVTHIFGGALGIVAVVLCVIFAAIHKNVYGVVSGAIFGGTMIILYSMSSIYHGLSPRLMAKKVFQVIDHCSIFLLIAGTVTPIALCTIREFNTAFGWSIFGVVWAAAALGITLNAIDLKKYAVFSMICYLLMGWCCIVAVKFLITGLGIGGMVFLLTGGIVYTIGAILYGLGKKKRYIHSVFHIFVCIGSFLHFMCILLYIM